jgi:hypothetical protein
VHSRQRIRKVFRTYKGLLCGKRAMRRTTPRSGLDGELSRWPSAAKSCLRHSSRIVLEQVRMSREVRIWAHSFHWPSTYMAALVKSAHSDFFHLNLPSSRAFSEVCAGSRSDFTRAAPRGSVVVVASGGRTAPNTCGGSADALAGATAATDLVAAQKFNRAPGQQRGHYTAPRLAPAHVRSCPTPE